MTTNQTESIQEPKNWSAKRTRRAIRYSVNLAKVLCKGPARSGLWVPESL